jgi:hypothetical protein
LHYSSTPHHQALNHVVNSNIKQFFKTFGIAHTWSWEKSKFIENNLIIARMVNNTPVWLCEILGNSYLSHVANICNTFNWWGNGLLYNKLSSPHHHNVWSLCHQSPKLRLACEHVCHMFHILFKLFSSQFYHELISSPTNFIGCMLMFKLQCLFISWTSYYEFV